MMQEMGKELKYGLRSGRFLILAVSFVFYALLTPVMLKMILPEILKSQGISIEALSSMMAMTQAACITSYMSDVLEIGTLIVAFSLCGLIAQEIRENTLVLPLCSGRRLGSIIGAKLLVFGAVLMAVMLVSLFVDYLYAGVLFAFDVEAMTILRSGLLQGLYMVFLIACIIMWGALIKKPIPTGFLTLATVYSMQIVGSLFDLHAWLPSGLLIQAQHLTTPPDASLMATVTITIGLIVAMYALAMMRLKGLEWNERHT